MAFLTLAGFVNGLEALMVAGVQRRYIHGPPSAVVNIPDLPALFIGYPALTGSRLTFGQQGGNGTLACQLFILVEPVVQNQQPRNFDNAVRLADALETALGTLPCSVGGVINWSVRVTEQPLAGEAYWAVIADIESSGRWA